MVLSAIEDGLSVRQACAYAGISTATFASWKTKYPRIEQLFEEARESARLNALKTIKDASKDDWRAAAEFLRLSFYPNYNNPTASVNVNALAVAATPPTLDEETRMRLIAQREASLAKLNAPHGLQDKPKVIEATVIEPVEQNNQAPATEPEATIDPKAMAELEEKARRETEEIHRREMEEKLAKARDAMTWKQLFGE
jgi:hypothetical protein